MKITHHSSLHLFSRSTEYTIGFYSTNPVGVERRMPCARNGSTVVIRQNGVICFVTSRFNNTIFYTYYDSINSLTGLAILQCLLFEGILHFSRVFCKQEREGLERDRRIGSVTLQNGSNVKRNAFFVNFLHIKRSLLPYKEQVPEFLIMRQLVLNLLFFTPKHNTHRREAVRLLREGQRAHGLRGVVPHHLLLLRLVENHAGRMVCSSPARHAPTQHPLLLPARHLPHRAVRLRALHALLHDALQRARPLLVHVSPHVEGRQLRRTESLCDAALQ